MPIELIPLPKQDTCNHPEHNPPNYYCVPQGYRAIHTCPACGKRTEMTAPQITCIGDHLT